MAREWKSELKPLHQFFLAPFHYSRHEVQWGISYPKISQSASEKVRKSYTRLSQILPASNIQYLRMLYLGVVCLEAPQLPWWFYRLTVLHTEVPTSSKNTQSKYAVSAFIVPQFDIKHLFYLTTWVIIKHLHFMYPVTVASGQAHLTFAVIKHFQFHFS